MRRADMNPKHPRAKKELTEDAQMMRLKSTEAVETQNDKKPLTRPVSYINIHCIAAMQTKLLSKFSNDLGSNLHKVRDV